MLPAAVALPEGFMRARRLVLAIACLAVLPATAGARDVTPWLGDEFESLIRENPDGAIRVFTLLMRDLERRGLLSEATEATGSAGARDRSNAGALLRMDIDRDGTVTAEEIAAFVRMRAAAPPLHPLCAFPTPSPGAELVLIGGYHGAAVPSVTVIGQDGAMSAARIAVEEGDRPLYVVAATFAPMIWQIDGAAARIEAFVTSTTSGVTGLDRARATFLDSDLCLPGTLTRPSAVPERFAADLGRDVVDIVAADYQLALITLPSGALDPLPETGRDPGASPAVGNFHDNKPGGLLLIDPEDVVAAHPAEPYEIAPHLAGLVALLEAGAIEAVEGDGFEPRVFRVVAPFPRFPPGLLGPWSPRFLLAPGVPLPGGDPGHSRIVDEATGACLSRTACDR
jgi:hypothetical protein